MAAYRLADHVDAVLQVASLDAPFCKVAFFEAGLAECVHPTQPKKSERVPCCLWPLCLRSACSYLERHRLHVDLGVPAPQ